MNAYAVYEDLDEYQSLSASDAADIALLRSFCVIASRMIDGSCRRKFYPRSETRYYDHPPNTGVLLLDDDLLEVATFTTQNTGETVSASDYYLMCGGTYNLTPYERIVMKSDGSRPNLLYSGTPQKANAVTGTWGFHDDWAAAFQDSNDTVQGDPLTAAATSLTVTDADGADIYGVTPRFKVQQLLKIEDEYLYTTDKNITTQVLTARRGVNGTTAASHAQDAIIYVYQPMREIWHAARRLAAWLYAQRDVAFTEQMASVEIGGVITIPKAAPVDVQTVTAIYRRRNVH